MNEGYENFTDKEREILSKYVTDTEGGIFVLRNLPEVIKGALFSRYSRSILGLRSLLLKEFINEDSESQFSAIAKEFESTQESGKTAVERAQAFYDRILDGYGDDSIGELGGAHLALETVSMLATKVIEDRRIGGSPLEKSTRYVYFDQKVNGEYLYYKKPLLVSTNFRDLYLETCDYLFDTYTEMKEGLTKKMEEAYPHNPNDPVAGYKASIRAKVCDCLRGLLPASTLTNMGIYGNGRFFENLVRVLSCHGLSEIRDIAEASSDQLTKVIPSFIRRALPTNPYQEKFATFFDTMRSEIKQQTKLHVQNVDKYTSSGVRLVSFDDESPVKVAAALLYENSDRGLEELQEYCKQLPSERIDEILNAAGGARENRRHKSPRALEHAEFTFEIVGDYGSYRDLQRHRMLTQERQLLSCDYGYYIPSEIKGTEFEEKYCEALDRAKEAYDKIAAAGLAEEGQYIVPMAYNIRWYYKVNLRSLQWLCELRSVPQGHPTYRYIAQEIAKQVVEKFPQFERFLQFVDYDGYELGRLSQEIRRVEKAEARQT